MQDKRSQASAGVATLADPTTDVSSPQKKSRVTIKRPTQSLTTMMVAQVHSIGITTSDAHRISAGILHIPEARQWLEMMDNRTQLLEHVAVYSMLFADRTGPMQAEFLWEPAHAAYPDMKPWLDDTDNILIVDISCFNTKDAPWNGGSSLRQIRKIVFSLKTTIRQLPHDEACGIVHSSLKLSTDMYLQELSSLRTPRSFTTSVSGFLSDAERNTQSQEEVEMKSVKLRNHNGNYIMSRAYGGQTNNRDIADKKEIVIYFAAAQTGIGNTPAHFWL